MNIRLPLLIILLFTFQASYSQPSLVTVNIKPDSSVTSGNVVFRCTISNPTKKNYRYTNFYSNCKNRIYPTFWQIVIKKDSINYMDCSLSYALVHWIEDPDVKLYKKSVRTFDFCLNFNKLSSGSEYPDLFKKLKPTDDAKQIIKAYNNESYGNYEVQIVYLKDPYDPQSPLSLISNWTKIEYVHK